MAPAVFVYQLWVQHRLRTLHPAIYEELGSPGIIMTGPSFRDRLWLTRFVFSSRCRYLNDSDLAKAVIVGRVLHVMCWILAGCLIYWMFDRFQRLTP